MLADSVLHQDPRYFYSGQGTKAQRAWYAIESAFRAKGDNGKWQPPYAGLIGAIAAAEICTYLLPGFAGHSTRLHGQKPDVPLRRPGRPKPGRGAVLEKGDDQHAGRFNRLRTRLCYVRGLR